MSGRDHRRIVALVTWLAFACALGAYAGVLREARARRAGVVDWSPYAARLGSEVARASGARAYPAYGIEDVGVAARRPSRATWRVETSESPRAATDYLYVVADEPLMYAPGATLRISVGRRRIGEFRSHSLGGHGPYSAAAPQTVLYVPPERTLGYEFPLPDVACRRACLVTVDANAAIWRIYRLGLVRKTLRFGSDVL